MARQPHNKNICWNLYVHISPFEYTLCNRLWSEHISVSIYARFEKHSLIVLLGLGTSTYITYDKTPAA